MTAKLYCFGETGNAYKVALALTLADMDWEPVFVDFFNGETRTPGVPRAQRDGRGAGAGGWRHDADASRA